MSTSEEQFGFVKGKSTTDGIFALRQLQEIYREGQRDQEYVGRKTPEMAPPGRRKRGRPEQRWMDSVNRDMRAIGTTNDEFHDRYIADIHNAPYTIVQMWRSLNVCFPACHTKCEGVLVFVRADLTQVIAHAHWSQ